MVIYFITFASGKQKYYDAANRLINQAENTKYFDKIILYTEKDFQLFSIVRLILTMQN